LSELINTRRYSKETLSFSRFYNNLTYLRKEIVALSGGSLFLRLEGSRTVAGENLYVKTFKKMCLSVRRSFE
jgi:hypothetical protein